MTLHVAPGATIAMATFDLPVPRTGKWSVTPRIMRRGGPGHAKLRLVPLGRPADAKDARLVWEWGDGELGASPTRDLCADLPPLETSRGIALDQAGARWELTATGGDVSFDQTILRAAR